MRDDNNISFFLCAGYKHSRLHTHSLSSAVDRRKSLTNIAAAS